MDDQPRLFADEGEPPVENGAPIASGPDDAPAAPDGTAGEDVSEFEPAPVTHVRIKVTDAPMNPVTLWVNGGGQCTIRIGEKGLVPVEALKALRDSDVQFEEIAE